MEGSTSDTSTGRGSARAGRSRLDQRKTTRRLSIDGDEGQDNDREDRVEEGNK